MPKNGMKSKKGTMEERLLAAAKKLLKKKGYAELSIRGICKEADCSTATFYQYFKSKDDLLVSFVIEWQDEEHGKNPSENYSLCTPIQAIVEIYTDSAKHICSLGLDILQKFLTPSNSALGSKSILNARSGKWILAEIDKQLHLAVEQEVFIDPLTAWTVEEDLCAVYYGYLFHWALLNGEYDVEKALRKMIIRCFNTYLKDEFKLPLEY